MAADKFADDGVSHCRAQAGERQEEPEGECITGKDCAGNWTDEDGDDRQGKASYASTATINYFEEHSKIFLRNTNI